MQSAHALLEEEKVRSDALLKRQHELIACLGWVSELGRSTAKTATEATLLLSVQQQLMTMGTGQAAGGEQIELLELLGSGSVSMCCNKGVVAQVCFL